MPEPDIPKPWPRPWTWAIVLAVLLFGAHATMRWWGQALVQVLFGDIPTPADAPPLVWALLGCWFILSLVGGKVIGSLYGDGSSVRERHRWQQQQAERQTQGALQRQLWEMEWRLRKVGLCARRSLRPSDVGRVIGMVEALETLPDLRQLMGILGYKLLS